MLRPLPCSTPLERGGCSRSSLDSGAEACKYAGALWEGGCEVSGNGGGRGSASRLWLRPHFPRTVAAVVLSGLPAAMLCSLRGCRCRRARGVRVPCRPGPRAFSHWRKATAGGLARDWLVAGRPRTWHLIGRAGSGLGGDEGIGGCRDMRVLG